MFVKVNLLRFFNKAGKKWISCLSIVLLLLSMFPAVALGAGDAVITIETDPTQLTEKNINDAGFTVDISLTGNTWAKTIALPPTTTTPPLTTHFVDIIDAFEPVLKGSFGGTATDLSKWNILLDSASFKVNDTYDKIKITIPKPSSSYDIVSDQEVKFTPSPSLLQDSTDIPQLKSFTITADPQATLSGSLTTGTTEANIVSGGRQLIIKLVNCRWDSEVATDATKRDLLFSALVAEESKTTQWAKVKSALITEADPSKVIKRDDDQTVTITLPKVPNFSIKDKMEVTLNEINANLIIYKSTPSESLTLKNIISKTFTVVGSNTVSWGTAPALTETSLKDSTDKTFTLTLNNNTWASDIATNSAKQTALLNGFTTSTDIAAWNKVKAGITTFTLNDKLDDKLDDKSKELTITIPAIPGYSISADQLVTVKIPSTVLENNYAPSNQLSFTITADPAVAVSGTLTTGITEMDIVNGTVNNGKINIVATLTNATWAPDVTIKKDKREKLIDYLLTPTPPTPPDPSTAWPKNVIDTIKAGATYTLTNPSTVTITLPPVPGFDIPTQVDISPLSFTESLSENDFKNELTSLEKADTLDISLNPFTISKITNQSASISGTVTTATESDIVTGGKTLVITLKNDVWAEDVVSTITSDTEDLIFLEPNTLKASPSNVARTSNEVLTITLPPMPGYKLTSDQTISVKIPAEALTFSKSTDPIVAGSFTVKAVTATLSGTAVAAPLNETSTLAGGKTIVITLKNATWKPDVATAHLADLQGCFTSPSGNWDNINSEISAQNITLSGKNVLTIKLPQALDYSEPDKPEEVSFKMNGTALSNLINEKLGTDKSLTDSKKILIGETAQSAVTATLTGSGLTVPDVANGNAIITITLTDGSWDSSLPKNKSKISSLVGGFKAEPDSASWAMVQAALKSANLTTNKPFALNSSNDTLTIKLPAVSNYGPVKDQEISLIIPKTALESATATVSTNSITIGVPRYTPENGNLKSLIGDGSFANYINEFPLQNIFLVVPTKLITSVVSKQSTIDSTTINSLDIDTHADVKSIKVIVNGKEYLRDEADSILNESERKFNVGFATEKAIKGSPSLDALISATEVYGTTELQSEVIIKVVASKTYSLAPSKDLSGSYSLYKTTNNASLLKNILKYYVPADLRIEIKK